MQKNPVFPIPMRRLANVSMPSSNLQNYPQSAHHVNGTEGDISVYPSKELKNKKSVLAYPSLGRSTPHTTQTDIQDALTYSSASMESDGQDSGEGHLRVYMNSLYRI